MGKGPIKIEYNDITPSKPWHVTRFLKRTNFGDFWDNLGDFATEEEAKARAASLKKEEAK